jgi:hypothetical protein
MEPAGQPAQSLSPDNPRFPQKVRDILHKAQSAWLKNTEVCDLLLHYAEYNLPVARDPPNLPPGKHYCFVCLPCLPCTTQRQKKKAAL